MGLRDDLWVDIAEAFDEDLADAVKTFSATRAAVSTKNPVNGTVTTGTPVTYSGRGVFSDYSNREIDGVNILATDERLIALANEVTMTPKIGDIVTGKRVLNVEKDPAEATFTLQLRK